MLDTLAKMNTWMVYLILLLITLFAAYFFIALGAFVGKMKTWKKGGKKNSSLGLIALLLALLGFVLAFIVIRFMILYTPYTGNTLIARVNSYKPDQPIADFKLVVGFFEKGEQINAETYYIKGQRWQLKGEWAQWRSPFHYLGLKKSFRLTHVQGQYINAKTSTRANSYALIRDDKNALWRSLVSFCKTVGLVQILTLTTEANTPNYRDTAAVWISEQGLLVRYNNDSVAVGRATDKKPSTPPEAGRARPKSSKKEYPRSEEQIRR